MGPQGSVEGAFCVLRAVEMVRLAAEVVG